MLSALLPGSDAGSEDLRRYDISISIMQSGLREAGKRNSEKDSIGMVRRFWARAGGAASACGEGTHSFCIFSFCDIHPFRN